jgi:uncharacterized RDD family membrane protein YckC
MRLLRAGHLVARRLNCGVRRMDRNPYSPPTAGVEDVDDRRAAPVATVFANLEREDFGGFWVRVLATFIDGLILYPVEEVVRFALLRLPGVATLTQMQMLALELASSLVVWTAYSGGLWASPWRATVGKRICGLVVVSDRLDRLSLARAVARYLASIVSGLLVIGVLMIPASRRRRALHDMMAGTLVVKRRALERAAGTTAFQGIVPAA